MSESPAGSRNARSDESLVLLARGGDREAFAELWQRHARAGLRVARRFSSSLDADDLVSEAYTRIYQRVLSGGGPAGAFRPYLYTTIRNLASRWGGSSREVQIDDISEFEDPAFSDDSAATAVDHSLTAKAFRSLPERWQAVLWYTEVEGMDAHETAPILGLSANGVAALSYRAREGLRKAWLQAHISDEAASGECRWTIRRLGDYARNGLSDRERARVSSHLEECVSCSDISGEVDYVGSRLALVMLPLLLGTAVGGAVIASASTSAGASAAQLASPAVSAVLHSAAVGTAPTIATGLAGAVPSAALVGTITLTLVVSAGLGLGVSHDPAVPGDAAPAHAVAPAAAPRPTPSVDDRAGSEVPVQADRSGVAATDPTPPRQDPASPINTLIPALPLRPGPVPEHSAPAGLVGVAADLDLSGTGMPGATVSAQVADVIYGTAVVTSQGTWAIHVSAFPRGIGPLSLEQRLRILGIAVPLDVPLGLVSTVAGVTVDLLN